MVYIKAEKLGGGGGGGGGCHIEGAMDYVCGLWSFVRSVNC